LLAGYRLARVGGICHRTLAPIALVMAPETWRAAHLVANAPLVRRKAGYIRIVGHAPAAGWLRRVNPDMPSADHLVVLAQGQEGISAAMSVPPGPRSPRRAVPAFCRRRHRWHRPAALGATPPATPSVAEPPSQRAVSPAQQTFSSAVNHAPRASVSQPPPS
jgi:hypothetical protein